MALSDFAVVILAAGKGTRLRSGLAKVLHPAGGRTLIEHVVRSCQPLKPQAIIAIVGHQAEQVSAVVEPLGVSTVLQQPQNGTGHAMLVARTALESSAHELPKNGSRRNGAPAKHAAAKHCIVLPGDAPLIRTETLLALARLHRQQNAAATILTAKVPNPAGYGRIVRRADGTVSAIVEDSALADDQRGIREINSSIYAFDLEKLWPFLAKLRPENKHRELYLTDAIALMREHGETVVAQLAPDADEVLGCNTRADLAAVDLVFRRRKRAALMSSGVSIQMPESVMVDPDVIVGEDTILEPGVQLLGHTKIGARCVVRTGSILADAALGNEVLVKPYSIVTASRLANGTQVGPFAHVRDGAVLMEGSRVGNFVEVKKSVLGERVKSMHLTYLGDARIGAQTNIGAGTITCNYDGVHKNPTTIGRGVFVGSDSALIAPVRVGDGAYIAAGSTITKNVPRDALALARGHQVNKLGWATERRRKNAEQAKRDHLAKNGPGSKTASGRGAATTKQVSSAGVRKGVRKPSHAT